MRFSFRLGLMLVILPVFGFGCLRFGPRIVKAPRSSSVAQVPATSVSSTEQEELGTLAYLQLGGAQVTVMRDGKSQPGEEGLELAGGDEVWVTQGVATLVYADYGVSQLEAGSRVVILPNDGTSASGIAAEVRLLAGQVWTRFEKLFGPDDHFSVSANGVVATVRGTGFGVSVSGDVTDVQVADHEVEISSEEEIEPSVASSSATVPQAVVLTAGQGLRTSGRELRAMNAGRLKTAVRALNMTDRARSGFRFGATRLQSERLRRPARSIRLPLKPVIPAAFASRVRILRSRAMLDKIFPRFVAPLRVPLPSEFAPTSGIPSIDGPSVTQP